MFRPFSSVRGGIIAGFGFLVLILVAVAAGSAWRVHEHQSDTAAMEDHADTAFLLQNGLVNAEAAASGVQRYVMVGGETLVAGDEDLLPEIRSDIAAAQESLAQALADTERRGDTEQAARLYQISAEADSIIAGVEMIIALQQSGDAQAAAAGLEVAVLPFREFEDKLEAAAETEAQRVSALRSRADTTGQVALLLLIVSGATGAALGLATSVLVARSIIKPLTSLEATAIAVSEGDLEARTQATGPRELAHLGAALNQMTESLLDASKRRELEEALRATEERLHTVVAGAPIVMFAADREGVITLAEGKGLEALGLKPDQVIGQSIFDIYRDTPQVRENFHRALAGDTFMSVAEVGGVMFEAWQSPLRDQNGEVSGVTGVVTDITERKRAEEAVRESETKFRTLAETTAAATFINQGTRICYVNSAVEAISGYTREELMAMNFWDVIHPDFQELARGRGLARQRSEQVPMRHEVKILTKDGDERWVDFTAGAFEFEGKPAVLGTAFDITERMRAEEALRESEERYRDLFENANDLIQSVAMDGSFVYVNRAWRDTVGYSEEEVRSVNLFDIIHPDSKAHCMEMFQHVMAGESLDHIEAMFVTKDGRSIWVEGSVFPGMEDGKLVATRGIFRDVTERKQAEEAVRESEERYRAVFEQAADSIVLIDTDTGELVQFNDRTHETLGYSRQEFQKLKIPDFEVVESAEEVAKHFEKILREGADSFETKHRTKGGEILDIEVRARAISIGERNFIQTIWSDITERKRAEETIKHLAYHDALTDLPNRMLFQDRLTVALAQARRKKRMLAVLFLDLDLFKVVNDTLGHGEGDKLLRRVAERLTGLVREGDTVARMGGDEFALLSTEIGHVEDAAQVAERVLESLRRPWVLHGQEFLVTASIGIALYPSDGDDAESLLRNADTAMYRAKEKGRNNYQLYTSAMNARIVERLALESSLRQGLERGEFEVYYQPQVNVRTGQVVGVEALVRWQHPERGLVLPAEFIPVAEETGLIVPLGEWVLRTACAQNKAWQEAGLPLMRVAVNLSARQFQQRNLTDTVAEVLQEIGLPPHLLELEITESVAMQDLDFTITMLRNLREMGVQIAIDDFGTGYSSLAYLKRFPIDAVKIDRSFVCDLMVDPNDAAIATTVITMAHSLKLSVIAEGVETEEQLTFLNQQQCDEMQGFLFSKAVPAGLVEKIVRTDGRKAGARAAVDSV